MKRFQFSARLMLLVVALLAVLSAWGGVARSEFLAEREAFQQRLAQQRLPTVQRQWHRRTTRQWRAPAASEPETTDRP